MRTTKYRQYLGDGEWHYWGFGVYGLNESTFTSPLASLNGGKSDQNTGLKDKNGKEIYEGDIVKWVLLEQFDDIKTGMVSEVKFSENYAGWTPMALDVDCEDGFYSYRVKEVEVIGNIYEDGHLLENESKGV